MCSFTLVQSYKFSFFIETGIYFSNSYRLARTVSVSSRGKLHICLSTPGTLLVSCISYSFPDCFDAVGNTGTAGTSYQIMDFTQSLGLALDYIYILNLKSANTSQKSVGMCERMSYLKA